MSLARCWTIDSSLTAAQTPVATEIQASTPVTCTAGLFKKGFLMSWGRYDWAPYVPVGQKVSQAVRQAAQLAKKEKREPAPVKLQGRTITKTFWGKAWCDNLTAYQDFSNRLPRGATYVRNGSVVDLVIKHRRIDAIVAGSEPYTVKIDITELDSKQWKSIRSDCSQSIDSLLDLLSGKLSDGVMKRLTDPKTGLFPLPKEIRMSCSCPDYSSCCKHLVAVMYCIAARLDTQPELLFLLRGVDHQELVSQAIAAGNLDRELSTAASGALGAQDLSELFGIELDSGTTQPAKAPTKKKAAAKKSSPRKVVNSSAKTGVTVKQKATPKKAPSEKSVVKSPAVKKSRKAEPEKPGKAAAAKKKLAVVQTASAEKKIPAAKKAAAKKKVVAKSKPVARSAAREVKRKP